MPFYTNTDRIPVSFCTYINYSHQLTDNGLALPRVVLESPLAPRPGGPH